MEHRAHARVVREMGGDIRRAARQGIELDLLPPDHHAASRVDAFGIEVLDGVTHDLDHAWVARFDHHAGVIPQRSTEPELGLESHVDAVDRQADRLHLEGWQVDLVRRIRLGGIAAGGVGQGKTEGHGEGQQEARARAEVHEKLLSKGVLRLNC